MSRTRLFPAGLLISVALVGCATTGAPAARHDGAGEANRGLVGSWLVSASRPGGQGVVLAMFTSDGTPKRDAPLGKTNSGRALLTPGLRQSVESGCL
jgi:hypothetical protein